MSGAVSSSSSSSIHQPPSPSGPNSTTVPPPSSLTPSPHPPPPIMSSPFTSSASPSQLANSPEATPSKAPPLSVSLNSSSDSAAQLLMDFEDEEDDTTALTGAPQESTHEGQQQQQEQPGGSDSVHLTEDGPPSRETVPNCTNNGTAEKDEHRNQQSKDSTPPGHQAEAINSNSNSSSSSTSSSTSSTPPLIPPPPVTSSSSLSSFNPTLSRSSSLSSPLPAASTCPPPLLPVSGPHGSLVRSNSAIAAQPPPPLDNPKAEPESSPRSQQNSQSRNTCPLNSQQQSSLPVIRNSVVSQQQPQQQQAPPPAPPNSSSASGAPSVSLAPSTAHGMSTGMLSISTVGGNHHSHSQHSSNSSSSSSTPHHHLAMDTYHHHHSPGPLSLGSLHHGPSSVHGPHTPQQTILSMSPSLGHSMSNVSVVTVASSSPNSNPKEAIEEACPVCGDRVSGYHYGLLTCESCKGFFKRTVQNKKVYTCVAERNCHIDKSQRKRCPYCRFQKCLEVGMKLEAVRADRMRGGRNKFGPMYKRDRARRLQVMRQKQLTKVGHMGGHGGHGHGHLGPPGLTMLPGGELNFLGAGGHHGGGHHTTTIFDGVKQELIQIPQLSSSTSSPDSSPSPGSTGGTAGNQGVGGPGGPLSAAAAAAAAAAVAAGHGGAGGHASHHSSSHSFMPQLSISAHPMTANSGNSSAGGGGGGQSGANSGQPLMNQAAAAAAADHLLKSWANGNGTAGGTLPGTSKSQYHEASANSTPLSGMPGSGGNTNKYLPTLVREFQSTMLDDKEWQAQLFGLLQNQTYNQCEVDLFELMCKVIDQSLFSQVDWARNSVFFKELKVDDQMKLLQHAWSDMLVLDHIHQRMHVGLPDESTLPNGQKFDLLSLALLGVPQVSDQLHRVIARLGELKVDANDYICLKFLILLNPDVRGLTNDKLVQVAHEQTKHAMLEYTVNFYPQIGDKFQQLMALVPEIRALTLRGEDFLYYKHMNGSAPTQTLLMEMLHAKKK